MPFGLPVVALGIIGYGAALAQGASLDFIDGIAWRIASLLVAWLGWLKRGRYTLFTEFSCDVRI